MVKRGIWKTYWRSRANQTVDVTLYPSFPTTWYFDAKISPIFIG